MYCVGWETLRNLNGEVIAIKGATIRNRECGFSGHSPLVTYRVLMRFMFD